jgi:hypothetical protein
MYFIERYLCIMEIYSEITREAKHVNGKWWRVCETAVAVENEYYMSDCVRV